MDLCDCTKSSNGQFSKTKRIFRYVILPSGIESLQICHDMPLPEELAIEREDIRKIYVCLKRCTLDQQLVIMLRLYSKSLPF